MSLYYKASPSKSSHGPHQIYLRTRTSSVGRSNNNNNDNNDKNNKSNSNYDDKNIKNKVYGRGPIQYASAFNLLNTNE